MEPLLVFPDPPPPSVAQALTDGGYLFLGASEVAEERYFRALDKKCHLYQAREVTGEAAFQVHKNLHEGKIGVLCLAPEEGLGIDDPEMRERVGEDKITAFRRHGA